MKVPIREQDDNDEPETDENETVELNYKKMASEIAQRDPNRPRYTLSELHEVLIEKNQLKVWLHETQEELELFKKKFVFNIGWSKLNIKTRVSSSLAIRCPV